jgi:hypothetical protein
MKKITAPLPFAGSQLDQTRHVLRSSTARLRVSSPAPMGLLGTVNLSQKAEVVETQRRW